MITSHKSSMDELRHLSAEDVDDVLRALEGRSSLFDFRIDNWCIWPILRFSVAMRLLNLPWTQVTNEEKLTALERIKLCISDLRGLKINQNDYAILTSSSGLADQINQKYVDIYFDDLIPHIGSYFKLEHVNNKEYLRNPTEVLFPRRMTTNLPYILAGIFAKTKFPKRIQSISAYISKILENEIQLHVSSQLISSLLRTFYWRKQVYKYLFSILRPHTLLLINAYNNHSIVAAAKEQKIKVIELQHGLISNHHPGYSWDKNALPHKRNMPIPDRIYLYGEYWREELLSNNFWGDDLIPTGSLRMERYRNLKSDRKHAEICNILVTTQGIDVANLCLFLVEFLKIIRGQINIILTIKLHPREHNSRMYNEIFTGFDNIRIVSGYSMPSTFDLLIESDFHASISSTCHYEALALGIPTLILPFPSNEKVLHLTKTGYAFTIQNPRQMAECVINNLHITVPIPIGDNFFRSNALNNILANLSNG